jgi:hypothetical protein
MDNRSSVIVIGVYAGVIAALVCSIGIALAIVSGSIVSEQVPHAKTAFETQLESAREIRQALAKPIPQPERLAPITAKPVKIATAKPAPRKQNPEAGMRQARQAFASIEEPRPAQTFFGFMSFGPGGRH